MHKSILVTGAAGFIGANLVKKLIETSEDITLVGLDNVNDYLYYEMQEKFFRRIKEFNI